MAALTSAAQGPTTLLQNWLFSPRGHYTRSKDEAHHISSHECWSYTSNLRAVEEFQACFPVLMVPYVLSPGFLTFLYIDWEAQNCIPAGTVQQALHSGGENSLSLKYTRGELTTVEFLQELGQQCFEIANICVPVNSFLTNLIRSEMIKQLPIMAEAIQCIRAEGLKIALLSNSFQLPNGERFLPLDQKHFDVIVEAYQEGKCKPDPRIYKLCLERLDVQPQESIFLDNSSQSLKAAAQLGIKTVKVDDLEVAFKELETYLGFPLKGFVPYTRSVRPTMEVPKDSLQKYLENVFSDQATGPLTLRQFGCGQSAQTYFVKFGDRSLVLKKEVLDSLLPSGPAVGREYRVLKALSEAGVPVPTVLALCEDRSILGTPFYLMEHCAGHVYRDASLPTLLPNQRRAIYAAMSEVLSKIHSTDLRAAKLQDSGDHGNYIQQQVDTWTKQYRATETHIIPAMERLIEWLPLHFPESQKTTVVHGNFRLDNLIFHPKRPEVLAVLGWKFSILGDPISDLANNCMAYFLPPQFDPMKGLAKYDLRHLGVPTAEEYCQKYCGHMGMELPENWNFYMAFVFFRLAAMLQRLHKQSLTGEVRTAQTHKYFMESSHIELGKVRPPEHASAGFGHSWLCMLIPLKFQAVEQNEALLRVSWISRRAKRFCVFTVVHFVVKLCLANRKKRPKGNTHTQHFSSCCSFLDAKSELGLFSVLIGGCCVLTSLLGGLSRGQSSEFLQVELSDF
uniref:Aminoglycoside phosphotransferase domain-containing protein n=1 Tax=Chrysolophus pictus TaxID=9089 RepID=A0A8C3PXS0_CHRPC